MLPVIARFGVDKSRVIGRMCVRGAEPAQGSAEGSAIVKPTRVPR
jgi:hypothetical protein